MRRIVVSSPGFVLVLALIMPLASTPAHAAVCNDVPGTMSWSRSGSGYVVVLDIPRPDFSTRYCSDNLFFFTDFDKRHIRSTWGHFEGTVARLGACDERPADDPVEGSVIKGMDLRGDLFTYQPDQRRIRRQSAHLTQSASPAGDSVFPGPAPIRGELAFGSQPRRELDRFSISTRIAGNCPPDGDPEAKILMMFF